VSDKGAGSNGAPSDRIRRHVAGATQTEQGDHMQPFPAQKTDLRFGAENSRTNRTLALARVLAFLVAILKPRTRAEDEIVARCPEYSWCDSLRQAGRLRQAPRP
jgi:hypothetical protein